MYLAFFHRGQSTFYQIRQSCLHSNSGHILSELVFDLGQRPEDWFDLFDQKICLFNDTLLQAVQQHVDTDAEIVLEELLWDFLPKQTREILARFRRKEYSRPRPLSDRERDEITNTIHIFDRRRLYYLYYGAIDQTRLYRMHEKLLRPLLQCSRDEREYYFTTLERQISPGEYHNYLYAAFNLQRHFDVSYAAFLPEALSLDEIGELMTEAICQLNQDTSFWLGEDRDNLLHHHLQRYLIMFFDFTPQKRNLENDYIRTFINSHRKFRWPKRKPDVSDEKILSLFSVPFTQLKKLEPRALTRLYRKKAMQLHPDQGGDQEQFVELTEMYKMLMTRKKE